MNFESIRIPDLRNRSFGPTNQHEKSLLLIRISINYALSDAMAVLNWSGLQATRGAPTGSDTTRQPSRKTGLPSRKRLRSKSRPQMSSRYFLMKALQGIGSAQQKSSIPANWRYIHAAPGQFSSESFRSLFCRVPYYRGATPDVGRALTSNFFVEFYQCRVFQVVKTHRQPLQPKLTNTTSHPPGRIKDASRPVRNVGQLQSVGMTFDGNWCGLERENAMRVCMVCSTAGPAYLGPRRQRSSLIKQTITKNPSLTSPKQFEPTLACAAGKLVMRSSAA